MMGGGVLSFERKEGLGVVGGIEMRLGIGIVACGWEGVMVVRWEALLVAKACVADGAFDLLDAVRELLQVLCLLTTGACPEL